MVGRFFIPNRPFTSNSHLGRTYGVARLVLMLVLALFAVIFFAYVFGSFIFTGGQLATTEPPRYEAITPHPLFIPPIPLMVGLDVLAGIASVVVASTARLRTIGDLPFLAAIPTTVLIMLTLALAHFFDDPNGIEVPVKWGSTRLSLYWVGVPFVAAGAVALIVAYVVLLRAKRAQSHRIPELEGHASGDLSQYREALTGDPNASREHTEERAQQVLDDLLAARRREGSETPPTRREHRNAGEDDGAEER